MGPFPASRSGFAYLLVLQDLFTKWVECCPLRKANGKKIREAIDDLIINRWGAPRVILTDNGTEFINRELKAFAEEHGIAHVTVPPYHPQANPVERVNRILKTMITAFIEQDHRDWDLHLSEFRFAYNTAYHTSMQATPAFLNFGREPPSVSSRREGPEPEIEIEETATAKWKERMERIQALRDWVIENLETAHQRQSRYYNLRRRDRRFVVGDQVLKRQHVLSSAAHAISAKLTTKFHGPFKIAKVLSSVVYEIADQEDRAIGKVHVKDLKPYIVASTS
ncbi:Retrovirus-related Pol polyprotein from transposon 412 [Formica fusca]